MAFGGETFEKLLGHEGRALEVGISVLIRNQRAGCFSLQYCEHDERLAVCISEEGFDEN